MNTALNTTPPLASTPGIPPALLSLCLAAASTDRAEIAAAAHRAYQTYAASTPEAQRNRIAAAYSTFNAIDGLRMPAKQKQEGLGRLLRNLSDNPLVIVVRGESLEMPERIAEAVQTDRNEARRFARFLDFLGQHMEVDGRPSVLFDYQKP
jgi:hypothetical protein